MKYVGCGLNAMDFVEISWLVLTGMDLVEKRFQTSLAKKAYLSAILICFRVYFLRREVCPRALTGSIQNEF
jgi:hypothetical protein